MALRVTPQGPPHISQGYAKGTVLVSKMAVLFPSLHLLWQRDNMGHERSMVSPLFTPMQTGVFSPHSQGKQTPELPVGWDVLDPETFQQ